MKFRNKTVVIEAITFDELVAHGLANSDDIQNGMAWSFEYEGHGITHHADDCYLIPTRQGTTKFERGDMLITNAQGEIYPCKGDIFAMIHEPAEQSIEVLSGFTTGYAIDPLESAITTTVGMLRDEHQQMTEAGVKEDTALCDRLGSHLDSLLAIQIERVTADETV